MHRKPVHVTYSRIKDMSEIPNDDVIRTNFSTNYTGQDVYHGEGKVLECRLNVTSTMRNANLMYVKFVEQTCTHTNKIVVLGKYKVFEGNMSTCVIDVIPAPSNKICWQHFPLPTKIRSVLSVRKVVTETFQ